MAEIDAAETPFTAEFQLQGFESIQGELEIEAIGESERVPRAGKIIVNEDGSYQFEPRASFVGTFEATVDRSAVANPPFTIQYAMERAGGPLLTLDADVDTTMCNCRLPVRFKSAPMVNSSSKPRPTSLEPSRWNWAFRIPC